VIAGGIAEKGFELGEALFEKERTSRSGVAFSKHEYDQVWELVAHPDRKIRLAIPPMLDWIKVLDPASKSPDTEHPYILHAGQRRSYNANLIFRNPAWRKEDPDGTLKIHPDDLVQPWAGSMPAGW